jgi:hypothetical protein
MLAVRLVRTRCIRPPFEYILSAGTAANLSNPQPLRPERRTDLVMSIRRCPGANRPGHSSVRVKQLPALKCPFMSPYASPDERRSVIIEAAREQRTHTV